MKKTRLNRRAFLRGVAGTVIALPLLECMLDDGGVAHADGSAFPCRYFFYQCPTALVVSSSRSDAMVPTQTGPGYELTPALRPLANRGVAANVSAVSGLFCAPLDVPGGYNVDYHGQSMKACLSGVRSGFSGVGWRPQGISADEIVAQATGDSVRFRKLYFQVDPRVPGSGISYEQTTGYSDEPDIVWKGIKPEASPANAYNTLFRDFVPPDGTIDPEVALELRLRQSSLSYASEQIATLDRRLGSVDRRTLDEHLTHIRELERRLLENGVGQRALGCRDPELGAIDPPELGPSLPDQEARADLFADLIQMAFACDMTRAITLGSVGGYTGAGMRHEQWQHIGGIHGELQHGASQAELDAANEWFVDVYARVLQRLAATEEGAGSVLDHSAAVFMMEGGKGLARDAQRSGDGGGDPNHSCDNMLCLVGGSAGGLVPGQHIDLSGADRHPAVVLNSALRAVGVNRELGEITGVVPGLFT